ncbi:MAG: YfiR family protein [Bacteroidetes bacterium]|nr:YfiR family protein [Bacteroidota bacterium]
MKKVKFIFSVLFIAFGASANAQTTNHQVYAVFVMSIAKFSAWPATDNKEFTITVFGKSKVFDELGRVAATKQVQGKKVEVLQEENASRIQPSQIIYVAENKSSQLNEIVQLFAGKPVMIIAEREGLFRRGAGFSFVVLENNTLRFDINKKDLEARQIKISQNLTTLANEII